MGKDIRVRGVRRKQIDEEKLAYAFLLLARQMRIKAPDGPTNTDETTPEKL